MLKIGYCTRKREETRRCTFNDNKSDSLFRSNFISFGMEYQEEKRKVIWGYINTIKVYRIIISKNKEYLIF